MKPKTMPVDAPIELDGVRVHNLKGINLRIRRGALTVVCGVSGSGKSSLAFDTMFAEGQRRYIETFSPAARQFLDRIERPAADRIEGIPPAIAVRQTSRMQNPRSTVGTRTELLDYLKLFFVRAGTAECPECHVPVTAFSAESAAAWLLECFAGCRAMVGFHSPEDRGDRLVNPADAIARLITEGYTRIIAAGRMWRLADLAGQPTHPDWLQPSAWIVVLDRIRVAADVLNRLTESLQAAFAAGEGDCVVLCETADAGLSAAEESLLIDGSPWVQNRFSEMPCCPVCNGRFAEPTTEELNSDLPSTLLLRLQGQLLADVAELEIGRLKLWINDAFDQLPPEKRRALQTISDQLQRRVEFLIDCGLTYLTLNRPIRTLSGGEAQRVMLTTAMASGLINTLYVLDEPTCGLHSRDTVQIIRAAHHLKSAGNTLVVVEHDPQFILAADEVVEIGPGAGEQGGHVVFQGTPEQLLRADESPTGRRLRDRMTSASDIDLYGSRESPIFTKATISREAHVRSPEGWLKLRGVSCHNIVELDVELPLGVICAVTGVSGSGKSSLIVDSLYPAVCRVKSQPCEMDSSSIVREIDGLEVVDRVLLLDQTPLQKSARSVPATWIGVFEPIRRLLAETHEGRKRNLSPTSFSFNSVRGGRCPVCAGLGAVTVKMQFLADIQTVCAECHGRRFRTDILEVRYRDRSVHDILEMTADESFAFFGGQHQIQQRLNALRQAGLGYLRLGQSLSTLSGGEAQRLRIASLLAGVSLSDGDTTPANRRSAKISSAGRILFLLDEPSAGLHLLDIDRLMFCLDYLVQTGHSVMVVEHDEYLLSQVDYRIELGPGAGREGGKIMSAGPRYQPVK